MSRLARLFLRMKLVSRLVASVGVGRTLPGGSPPDAIYGVFPFGPLHVRVTSGSDCMGVDSFSRVNSVNSVRWSGSVPSETRISSVGAILSSRPHECCTAFFETARTSGVLLFRQRIHQIFREPVVFSISLLFDKRFFAPAARDFGLPSNELFDLFFTDRTGRREYCVESPLGSPCFNRVFSAIVASGRGKAVVAAVSSQSAAGPPSCLSGLLHRVVTRLM